MKKKYMELIIENGNDIVNSYNMNLCKKYIQHGNISVYDHSINVAIMCLRVSNLLKIKVDNKSLIRGALLHDYFLYDWHDKDKSHRLHGFRHAKFAYKNANKEYNLNKIEKNMILTHMFPLNIKIPKYKESIILCISDKICATSEVIITLKEKLRYKLINE